MNYLALLYSALTSVVATGIVLTFHMPRVLQLLRLRGVQHRAKADEKTPFLQGPNRPRLATSWRVLVVLGPLFIGGCAQVPEVATHPVRCTETSNHHDGDTFTCMPEQGSKFVVRVASIDAPETGQAYWRAARARLRELAASGSVVDCYKVDRYDRRVCRLKTSQGRDAADVMLSDGLAWYSEDFAGEDAPAARERYRRLQTEAQAAKRGLWIEPSPTSPMTCRKRRRDGLRC
jgi:endonuclease YncB( thermonuclease family)